MSTLPGPTSCPAGTKSWPANLWHHLHAALGAQCRGATCTQHSELNAEVPPARIRSTVQRCHLHAFQQRLHAFGARCRGAELVPRMPWRTKRDRALDLLCTVANRMRELRK